MMNHHNPPMIGCSTPMEKLRGEIDQVAGMDLTVMIRGERGTGKDVVAREILRNVVKRGVFTGKSEWIRQEDLPFDFAQRLATPLSKLADHDEQLRELSHQLFVAALKQCHGNRSRAAILLGLTRNKFYRLLRLHGLDGESSDNGRGESDWIQ